MFTKVLILAGLVLAVSANPLLEDLPEPGQLAFVLSEDEFEDYLDKYLAIQEGKLVEEQMAKTTKSSGCTLRVNGDLGQPQPLYLKTNKLDFIEPTSNSGLIHFNTGDDIVIACSGSGRNVAHTQITTTTQTATAKCVRDTIVSGEGWLDGEGEFFGLLCTSNAQYVAEPTNERCWNDNIVIRIGFHVDNDFVTLFHSCFDQSRLEVVYVWYEQLPPNAVHQSGVTRPGWLVSSFFPGVSIDSRYTQVNQKIKIAEFVGEELADKYVTSYQYLARGHLAAKTDFIFATGQRASHFFVNAAPQWQPFNAGNWNYLEQNLRARVGAANYHTKVYTGTFGVSQLRNQTGHLVDIYLYTDANNNYQLPIPMYYYKVVYDESLQLGTAFVSINNPYYTLEEVKERAFCTDRCRNNDAFSWLRWEPDRIETGYSFCCEVDDFRRTVPHLPEFTVKGLLA